MRYPPRHGFSLVELSIVLVILGLITGGILAGKTLIHSAELRTVSTEYMRYATAAGSFRQKYFALPGDMPNASQFWGAADGSTGSTAGCLTVVSTTAATCNGNGDGRIWASTASAEEYRAWQHLANAGLIEGHYSGYYSGVPSSYSPRMKFASNSYWNVATDITGVTGNTQFFATPAAGNLLSPYDNANFYNMTPEDAWNIDKKLDDGLPSKGKIIANKGDSSYRCTDKYGQAVGADTGAVYNLSYTTISCYLTFGQAF